MRQGFKDAVTNLKDSLVRLGENANLWNRGCASYSNLDEDDKLRFHCVIAERYGAFELFYDYHKSRNVKIEAIHGINRWMREDFATLGVRTWWEERGRETYSYDFGAIVDEVVADNGARS
jgi:hypothetical protein